MRATRSVSNKGADAADAKSPSKPIKSEAAATPASKETRKRKANDADIKSEPATPKRANTKSTPKSSAKSLKSALIPDLSASAKTSDTESPSKKSDKTKTNPYGLSPGQSPYPTYTHPTPEECQDVHDRLAAIHGTVTAPKTIPVPSLNSSGCGEVPSVLDALIRTRLSAATNNENSSRAFRGLVTRFGIIKHGIGKGSVDWNAVRLADVADVKEAIKSGGLADVKSRDIKKILQLVYEENQARKEELKREEVPPETSEAAEPVNKEKEVGLAEEEVISLDHLHTMDNDSAFNKLIGYPGVGPKTASCVLLFCMQRPSFAVDTHVFRLTRWLGWTPSDAEVKRMAKDVKSANASPVKAKAVKDEEDNIKQEDVTSKATPKKAKGPPPVTRNSTYAHLDVLIPDNLKYALHYLFIKHGKFCPECSAKKDSKIRAEWGDKKCPIKDLKVGKSGRKKVKAEDRKADAVKDEGDDDGELSELTDDLSELEGKDTEDIKEEED